MAVYVILLTFYSKIHVETCTYVKHKCKNHRNSKKTEQVPSICAFIAVCCCDWGATVNEKPLIAFSVLIQLLYFTCVSTENLERKFCLARPLTPFWNCTRKFKNLRSRLFCWNFLSNTEQICSVYIHKTRWISKQCEKQKN